MSGQPMSAAPKDRPILAYVEDRQENCPDCGPRGLCLYHGHAEGMGFVPTGFAIVEWGGAWDDTTWESPTAGHMPDWWFQTNSDFEIAANPVEWWPLPEPPDA